MANAQMIHDAQEYLAGEAVAGWLIYDYLGCNPVLAQVAPAPGHAVPVHAEARRDQTMSGRRGELHDAGERDHVPVARGLRRRWRVLSFTLILRKAS